MLNQARPLFQEFHSTIKHKYCIVNKQEIAVNLTDALIPIGVRNHFRSQRRFERGVTHRSTGNKRKIQPTLEYFESIKPGLRIEKS